MMKIILAVCFIPVWFVIYFILLNAVKPKKNIILGVTLPHNAQNETETQIICSSFRKWLGIVMIPLLLLMVTPFFMESMGAAMTWLFTWILLLIVGSMAVFAVHRGKLMVLKRDNNWYSAAAGRSLVDIKAAALPSNKIKGTWFLPPVIASKIPLVYSIIIPAERDLAFIFGIFACMTILFWLFYYFIFRLRSELVNENVSLTAALTRVRRYNWGKFWLIASWINGAVTLLLWVFIENVTAFIVICLAYTLLLIALALHTEFAARIAQQKLTAGDSGDLYLDEDDYWIFGLFYYNPNDMHFLVNDRIGISMSVNLARPVGKVLMAFSVLCIAALPFAGIWLWADELTPTRLILSENTLIARHTRDRYVIRLQSIESVELVETLPSMIRVGGLGMPNLYKGNFRVSGYGASRVCIQPGDPPFLVIYSNNNTYFINDRDSNVTREVYVVLRR